MANPKRADSARIAAMSARPFLACISTSEPPRKSIPTCMPNTRKSPMAITDASADTGKLHRLQRMKG